MDWGNCEFVRRQLERVLASDGFARNERLKRFLQYVVEEELSGRGDRLKESVVGVEVFGRRPDYDVRQDSVVRTEAARLRARLTGYYRNGGAADTFVIELPKGGYKPAFREVALPAAATIQRRRYWPIVAFAVAAVAAFAT